METAVVILNFNGINWLKKFLPNVIQHSDKEAEIIIIDNGSTDKSTDYLSQNFPTLKVISLKSNSGFTGGYNQGLKALTHKYFILLNSDVQVTQNWISPMIEMFNKNESIAAIQPKILSFNKKDKFEYAGAAGGYIDALGYPFCRGRVFNQIESDTNQYNSTEEVFWASGACLFIRSSDFFENNGFDDNFFAHMEEIDLCWRLQNKGKKIIFNPNSTVYHVGGGTLDYNSPTKTFLNFRNALFMLHKNDSRNVILIIISKMIFDGIAGIRFLIGGKPKLFLSILKAHFHYYKSIKRLTVFRRNNKRKPNKVLKGFINRLIVWDYFILKKKYFSEIISKQ